MRAWSAHSLKILLLGALLMWSACASSVPPAEEEGGNNQGTPEEDASEEPGNNQETPDLGAPDLPSPGEDAEEDTGGESDVPSLPSCEPSEEVCDAVDNDCDGEVDEQLACVCTGDNACYLGPPQTRGVGACRDGARQCDGTGEFFEVCSGGVLPELELCQDGRDNNCDGRVDEAPCIETCQPGEQRICYNGPQEVAGIGFCKFGVQDCNQSNTWNECRGYRLPELEQCGDAVDNDCDGLIDVDCAEHLPLIQDEYDVTETSNRQPVDFIMAVDNSGSMRDVVLQVEQNLGEFARRMVRSEIDYRFVMVSERGTSELRPDICVPEPLAGPNCADNERFLHVNHSVGSSSALQDMLTCHDGCSGGSYGTFLRRNAFKQVIAVSDDESNLAWGAFRDQMRPKIGNFNLNAVVGIRPGGCVVRVGHNYMEGVTETGGEALHICDNDWGIVIDVIFEATLANLKESYTLSSSPVIDTLRVFIQEGNGPKIEQFGNWNYNETFRVLSFLPNLGPPLGARVFIEYRLLDE